MRVGSPQWKLANHIARSITAILLVGTAFAAIVFGFALAWLILKWVMTFL
jgi:hypothetical protein